MTDFVLPSRPEKLFRIYYPNEHYFEHAPTGSLDDNRPIVPPYFVPNDQWHLFSGLEFPGHIGLFLFDQRHVEFAFTHGVVWDGWQFPRYSNFLLIDIDKNASHSIPRLKHCLRKYDWLLYDTGGGEDHYHFVLPHTLFRCDHWAIFYRTFVGRAGIMFDPTIYQPLCAMALPGRVHPRTGKRKVLVEANSGELFKIPQFDSMYDFDPFFMEVFKERGEVS